MNITQKNRPGLMPLALYLTLFASLLFSINVWSQGLQQASQNATTVQSANSPRTAVEVMPVFPGGDARMMEYLAKNLRYPISAQLAGIEGRVNARFVIDSDGSITYVEILRGVNLALDQEVLRLIKSMPKWIPGREKGVNVPVYYTIPILFKLNVDTSPQLPKKPKKTKEPAPLTLIQLNNGQTITTQNAATNATLPLIVVDDIPYQIEGLDLTKAGDDEIFKALNLTRADIESTFILKGKDAEKREGERGKNGIVLIVKNLSLSSIQARPDVMPVFPGGDEGLMNYISQRLMYPKSAQEQGIEGRVQLRYVIDKDGAVKNVEVVKSVDPACDREAMRVIKGMPKWTPAQKDGVSVATYYTIPILFKLKRSTNAY